MDLKKALGLHQHDIDSEEERRRLRLYINLKLSSSGQPITLTGTDDDFLSVSSDLLQSYREKSRLLSNYLCPADQRIQDFIDAYLKDCDLAETPKLPANTMVLDRHGVARELSIPAGTDEFQSDIINSYRVKQGVLHNPASDRRTTKGSFHIAEGGLPVPGDKKEVPRVTVSRLLHAALTPPDELIQLPFSAKNENPAKMFVSLLLRPKVCPEIPGVSPQKSMEIRFFAPGNLVSNLDFVESIFGNAGNPNLAEHDAALDTDHWTGHSGCVILAPHLTQLTKKELGLPAWDDATPRQRHDGMCWQDPDELYNDGNGFKITMRDKRGVIVTILADNYYGYCKKEVKTMLSYAANLYGLAEEEHAGGALAFPRRNHGTEYGAGSRSRKDPHSLKEVIKLFGDILEVQEEGHAIDKRFPNLIYIPRDIKINLEKQTVSWRTTLGLKKSIKLQPNKIYMQPNGYRVEMQKHPGAPSWRLIGTDPEGTFCHKPSTVSGGGKSEISKSLDDAVIYGSIFVNDFEEDMRAVKDIFNRDYRKRLKPEFANVDRDPSRKPLSEDRSLGSVIKLLTPSPANTDEYNAWLETIPDRILSMVFIIKRMYSPEWGENWCEHFSVDLINGQEGHVLKADGRPLVASYLRVGLEDHAAWRTYKVRQDFIAADKVQMEDDITASVVVNAGVLPNNSPRSHSPSVKLVDNCEYRLFQRPDDAIIPGFDTQTEIDMAQPGNFIANYEPLKGDKLNEIVEDVATFQNYTEPMKKLLQEAYDDGNCYVVSSAWPRVIDGEFSKNPRYLQLRPDLQYPFHRYVAEMGTRLHRRIPLDEQVCNPVNAVLSGRRNNPGEEGIRPLAVFNPIHYQELPELFMDFICSLTGKSPSTTGAGSEGALTKGPFNALRTTADLNNALVSFILTDYAGFSSAAGYVGPKRRVDHDISLLVPEIWARLKEHERDPKNMLRHGHLEMLEDFEYEGSTVLASRLGFRITEQFVADFMGRIFDNPSAVFDEAMLKPETQSIEEFVDGIGNIVEAQQRVAQRYLDDGSIEDACPPLQALIYIMATGEYQGMDAHSEEFRAMFTRESLLKSDWYHERLEIKQQRDMELWQRHIAYLGEFLEKESHADVADKLHIKERLEAARKKLEAVSSDAYLQSLVGTIGADPVAPYRNTRARVNKAA
ncbi:MAG: hypothetical protein DSZ33_00955 [Gammaproteobacteria bacterium]|nr:MAG: hypothetical protein DSZ33_00955 [Gammaproteobacteria bacterium]